MIIFCASWVLGIKIRALEDLQWKKTQFWVLHSGDSCHHRDEQTVTMLREQMTVRMVTGQPSWPLEQTTLQGVAWVTSMWGGGWKTHHDDRYDRWVDRHELGWPFLGRRLDFSSCIWFQWLLVVVLLCLTSWWIKLICFMSCLNTLWMYTHVLLNAWMIWYWRCKWFEGDGGLIISSCVVAFHTSWCTDFGSMLCRWFRVGD